jgi:uncharacterized protein
MVIYNKLVRDKIPEIIKQKDKNPVTHIATEEEYKQKLHEKLKEEVGEFIKEPSEEELADISEVLDSIIVNNNFNKKNIDKIKEQKAKERGSFKDRIILDEVKD